MLNQHEIAVEMNDLYRRCRLNAKYYGHMVARQRRINLVVETTIAVGTSAAVASATLSSSIGHAVFYTCGIFAAALTASKPVWDLPGKIGVLQGQRIAYAALHARIERACRDSKICGSVTDIHAQSLAQITEDFDAAELNDVENPNRKVLESITSQVNEELPPGKLFWPSGDSTTSPAGA